VLRFLPGPFALLATLALVGAFLLWRQRQRIDTRLFVLLGSFVVVMLVALLPFFAAARLRVPVLPVLFLFAGVAVQVFAADVRARRARPAGILLGAVALLTLLQLQLPYRYEPDAAFWHFQRGTAWQAAGDVTQAEQEFRAALQAQPRHYRARHNLATLLAQRSDTQAALKEWKEALRLQPESATLLGSMGAALLAENQPDSALVYLQKAIDRNPDMADYHSNLARALQALGRGREALKEMRNAALLEPDRADNWRALAGMAQARGVTPLMLEGWTRAARLEPDPYLANNIAWVLATHPDASYRDGPKAVQLATAACNSTNRKVRAFLDTLAAAQAEVGDFDAAIATAQLSLSMAEQAQEMDAADKARQRIEMFRRKVPFRDLSLQDD
jgi:tetratricopeptide (TPR) repeat protein